MEVDLTQYTRINRKGNVITYENRGNEYPFSTEREAEQFENLYNFLAVDALKEVMSVIKKHNVVSNAEELSEEDLAFHAGQYFEKGIYRISAPTLDSVEKKANELFALSKDINLLKRVGLLENQTS